MTKYKDLFFRQNGIDLSSDPVSNVFLIKVYYKYQRRNQWVNWRGDTKLVISAHPRFDLSLQATKDSAEKQRTRGTRFVIGETPALCVIGKKYTLIVANILEKFPFKQCDFSTIKMPLSLGDVEARLKANEWCVSAIYTGKSENLVVAKNNEIYCAITSESPGGKKPLAWYREPIDINCEKLLQFMKNLDLQRT